MQETQLNGESLDIVSENVSKLKELFPEIVTEDKIDFDKLKEVLGKYTEDDNERYNFTWKGKSASLRLAQTPSTGTLRPCKEESKNWDTTENLYIEGDNLEVLKLLQKSYYGKINMIYIDPPYNTGKEFVYPDDYKDNLQNYLEMTGQISSEGTKLSTNTDASGRYHTNWLNMMYPRLRLARNLLTDDGVIFISIDDHEVHNLVKLCDELFGEENFVTSFIWEKKKKPSFLNKNVGTKTEYVVVYAMNRMNTGAFSVELTEKGKKYPFNNAGNGLNILKFPPKTVKFLMEDQIVKKQDMSEGKIITRLLNDLIIDKGYNKNELVLEGEWRYSQEKLNIILENNEEIIISKIPFRPNHIKSGGEIKKMHNLLTINHYKIKTNEDADKEMTKIFDKSLFDYSKPYQYIKFLVKSFTFNKKEALILDFFAGSSTTAHAIIDLNAEDNSNRKFIMVQLPEPTNENSEAKNAGYNNICEIGKERIRRAGDKILSEMNQNGQTSLNSKLNHDLDIGFKVFKLDSSNLSKWDPEYDNLEQTLLDSVENLVPGREKLDLVYEIMLKYGIDLTLAIEEYSIKDKKFYSIGFGALIICLDDNLTSDMGSEIIKLKDNLSPEIMRVVFKDNGFASDSDKTNIKETLKTNGIEEFVTI